MIYLKLFLTFLKIGAVSFGGGYGMISLIREEVLAAGWLPEKELVDFIAVSESTPGPVAVNMATFIGSSQAGMTGALTATAGVVLPSFIIILLIAALVKKIAEYAGVKAVLGAVTPAVTGLITATAAILFLSCVTGLRTVGDRATCDWKALIITAIILLVAAVYRKIRKKSFPPALLLLISGGLGIALYL